jgi:hypothetical protein
MINAEPLSPSEQRLRTLLRFFAFLFGAGALSFFVRPDGTVADLNRVGVLFGLPPLAPGDSPVDADFWLVLAVANMATIAACCGLAAADVRGRRVLVYPVVVSKLASSIGGLLCFLFRAPAFPYLSALLVDLPIALVLLAALRAAPAHQARPEVRAA